VNELDFEAIPSSQRSRKAACRKADGLGIRECIQPSGLHIPSQSYIKSKSSWVLVAHAYNPSYCKARDQEDSG
jgi:hypothetical protein